MGKPKNLLMPPVIDLIHVLNFVPKDLKSTHGKGNLLISLIMLFGWVLMWEAGNRFWKCNSKQNPIPLK